VTLKVARDCCVVEPDVFLPCLLGRLDWNILLTASIAEVTDWLKGAVSVGADSCSANQDIHRILWHSKVRYRLHNSPRIMPDESVPRPPTLFIEDRVQFHHSSRSRSSQWPLSFRFTHQNLACTSAVPHSATCPPPLRAVITLTTYDGGCGLCTACWQGGQLSSVTADRLPCVRSDCWQAVQSLYLHRGAEA